MSQTQTKPHTPPKPRTSAPPNPTPNAPNFLLQKTQEPSSGQKVVFAVRSGNSKGLTQLQVSEIKDVQKEQSKHFRLLVFR